jgi:predicted DNA-binding protein
MSQKATTGVRLDDKLEERLTIAVEKAGLPKADVMRIALELGLREIEDIGYNIGDALHNYWRITQEKKK